MDKFLIIRLSSLGDIIHTLPAFSALRDNFQNAEITWLVEENGKDILDLVQGLNHVVVVKAKSKKWHPQEFKSEISRIKQEIRDKEQVALDFQGLLKSAYFAYLSKAQKRIGFNKKNLREPFASWFYTHQASLFDENQHVIYKNLSLLETIGISQKALQFPLVLPEELITRVREKLNQQGYDGEKKLLILNVGAAWESKRWFAEKWIELVNNIKNETYYPLLLWGSTIEKELAEAVATKSGAILAPFLSIKEVIALIHEAALVVSGDTFALQVACAFSKPVVALFGPTNPRRNGPFQPQDAVVFHELECSYCYKRTCSDLACLKDIKPEEVAGPCIQIMRDNV